MSTNLNGSFDYILNHTIEMFQKKKRFSLGTKNNDKIKFHLLKNYLINKKIRHQQTQHLSSLVQKWGVIH
jgi:hypothetical protein